MNKVNKSQEGYLDIVLPDPSIASLQIIQIHYSTSPDKQIIEDGRLIARWSANKLRGHKDIQILTVLQLGSEVTDLESNLDFIKEDIINIKTNNRIAWIKSKITTHGDIQFQVSPKSKGIAADSSRIHIYQNQTNTLAHEHFFGKRKNQIKKIEHFITNDKYLISSIATNLYQKPNNKYCEYLFRYLIEAQPNNFSNHNFLGVYLARKGEFGQAVLHLRKALSLAHSSYGKANVYYGLANYYALNNEKEKAIELLKLAQETHASFDILSTIKDQDFANLKDYAPFLKLMKVSK